MNTIICKYDLNLCALLAFKICIITALGAAALRAETTTRQVQKTLMAAETEISKTGCRFETSFSALALKPIVSNLHYTSTTAPDGTTYDVTPNYQFGFDVGIAAHICSLDTQLALNWERIHTSNQSAFDLTSGDAFNSVQFNFDEVNLNYGQHLVYDNHLQGNIYYGLSMVHIKQLRTAMYADDNNIVLDTTIAPSVSIFNGAGIQAGLDFSYDITHGLRLAGAGAVSLLAGKAHSCDIVPEHETDQDAQQAPFSGNQRTQLVPALKQNLGLAYVVSCAERCYFKLEAGYQAQVYLNALQSTASASTSNFALIGPYVTLSLGF